MYLCVYACLYEQHNIVHYYVWLIQIFMACLVSLWIVFKGGFIHMHT